MIGSVLSLFLMVQFGCLQYVSVVYTGHAHLLRIVE